MTILKLVATAIISAAATAPLTIWLVNIPPLFKKPTIPPLIFTEEKRELVIWGSWSASDLYQDLATVATEIRCSKEQMACTEGLGVLLTHEEGQDLEAKAFAYRVEEWSNEAINAITTNMETECLQRRLSIDLRQKSAVLNWTPTSTCKDGDTGKAILVGDK